MREPLALDARLHFLTGKGGVGKSTLVAALALDAAARGHRTLVVELGHRATLQHLFDTSEVGYTPTEVAHNLWATNIDSEEALKAYIDAHVPIRALARRIARSRSLKRFFQAAPAVTEVLTLFRLQQLYVGTAEVAGPFDKIFVDFDSSGHALMFLEVPRVFERLTESGPFASLLRDARTWMHDSAQTRWHLVTLPDALPLKETQELHAAIRKDHPDLPLGHLFVNRCGFLRPAIEAEAEVEVEVEEVSTSTPALSTETLSSHSAEMRRALRIADQRQREHQRDRVQHLHMESLDIRLLPELPSTRLDTSQLQYLGTCASVTDHATVATAPLEDLGPDPSISISEHATGLPIAKTKTRLIVCVGPGGVGKTTLAAAVALQSALRGRRVALVTIDPARRLADALGLDGLSDHVTRVADTPAGGSLDAAMLDTKHSYDNLITRISPSKEAETRILNNRVYQSFSKTLARSHAYVAMERLHHLLSQQAYDLIVLDTPPTRSALEILDAPNRLYRFLDEKVLRAFLGDPNGGAAAWLKAQGSAIAIRLFGTLVGRGMMQELASFFEVFLSMRHGFATRARETQEILTSEQAEFLLITAPFATPLFDAGFLMQGLAQREVTLDAVVFNRGYRCFPDGPPVILSDQEHMCPPADDDWRHIHQVHAGNRARLREIDRFLESATTPVAAYACPDFTEAPTSLDALHELAVSVRSLQRRPDSRKPKA